MRPQGYLVAFAALSGMLLYGALAAGALWLARHRASKHVLRVAWTVVGGTSALVLILGAAWVNSALHGAPALTAVLIWIFAIAFIVIQLVIAFWVWWERLRGTRV